MSTRIRKLTPVEAAKLAKKERNLDKALKKPYFSMLSIMLGVGFGLLLIMAMGANAGVFLSAVVRGSFGSEMAIGNWLANFAWLALVGLAFSLAYKVKLFNIGIVSQMIFAAIVAHMLGFYIDMGPFGWMIIILVAAAVGAMVGWLIAVMKTSLGIHEVVSSIMLNWIAFRFMQWYTNPAYHDVSNGGHINGAGSSTEAVLEGNNMTPFGMEQWLQGSSFNIMVFVAFALIIILFVVYKWTSFGHKTHIVGHSMDAARAHGINVKAKQNQGMALAGAMAGLGGIAIWLGARQGVLPAQLTAMPTEGFQGIAIGLIGFTGPLGIMFAALFFSILNTGSMTLGAHMNEQAVNMVIASIIWFSAGTAFFMEWNPWPQWRISAEKRGWIKPKLEDVVKSYESNGSTRIDNQSNEIIKDNKSKDIIKDSKAKTDKKSRKAEKAEKAKNKKGDNK